MTKQDGPRYDENYLRQGSPTNTTFAESFPRMHAGGNIAIAATGVALAVAIPLQAGETVSNVTFITATTAASSPTAGYAALRTPAGAVVAQTADFGSTARGANTVFTVAFATPYTPTTSGLFLVEISFTASTVPTLRGVDLGNAVVSGNLGLGAKPLSQSHGSSVGATPPATIATPTNVATVPYLVLT